jgi:hypothetical protein
MGTTEAEAWTATSAKRKARVLHLRRKHERKAELAAARTEREARKAEREARKAELTACREMVEAFYAQGCVLCGEAARCCLKAHHVEPRLKLFELREVFMGEYYSPEEVEEEIAKCACLCGNCHTKVHRGLLRLPAP